MTPSEIAQLEELVARLEQTPTNFIENGVTAFNCLDALRALLDEVKYGD